ncbi:MAG: hypothetical protein K1X74_08995 [Pirellulales bacterium]|nr:hypothetical protein [Pirellulales bacterium]
MALSNCWRGFCKAVLIAWASPASVIGLLLGALVLATGGRARYVAGALEFIGGAARPLFDRLPIGPVAMTLGHVIVGRDECGLDRAALHERVHVRQYERWGPFFLPAYLLCSLVLWASGRRAYLDNPFEQQAYREAP